MQIYAIRVIEPNLPLIKRLNRGVTPRVEGGVTYFTFCPEYDFDEPTIVPESEVLALSRNGMLTMVLGKK